MKSINNIYKTVCFTAFLALSTSSCTEWLTIYPHDRVVEENFWEDKNDLEGVRNGAYKQMANTVSKFAVWGDLRSDTYSINGVQRSEQDSRETYIKIVNGEPDSSMSVFDWSGVYTTINYCNKVLQHGEEVLAKDKQFTRGEWIQMQAEMTALRALNYFYLIRAFKDVPYTTKVINKDSEVENFPLTNQLVILDSIIADCNRVKDNARNRFSSLKDSKGMITKSAIYAMLADMYLWRGSLHYGRHNDMTTQRYSFTDKDGNTTAYSVQDDYDAAIACADQSLKYLAEQNYYERQNKIEDLSSSLEPINFGLENCDMIRNDFTDMSESNPPMLEAMTEIFREGNSTESIFELQFKQSDGTENSIVNSLYGYNNGTHLEINRTSLDAVYNGGVTSDTDNGGKWDSRLWVCCQNKMVSKREENPEQGGNNYCLKYSIPDGYNFIVWEGQSSNLEIKKFVHTSDKYRNWIVYRMTDVMLIKAEALASKTYKKSGTPSSSEAETICHAIHRRSYCNYQHPEKKPNETFTNKTDSIGNARTKLGSGRGSDVVVLNERQIELLGEGKRWFDLVRYAERNAKVGDPDDPREEGVGDGSSGLKKMLSDFYSDTERRNLEIRLKNRYGLYCPIHEMEVKASNGAIEQNPVWNKSKYER